MQMHDYDFRKIRQEMSNLDGRIKEIEKGVAELRESLVNYKHKYGEQPIQEWLESIDSTKQKDPEE